MAIQTYAGGGNFTDRYVVDSNGYMFTVGPKNNSGKLWQPGTRGIVYQDAKFTSTTNDLAQFRVRTVNTNLQWRTVNTADGYYSIAYNSGVYRQINDGDLLGMGDIIRQDDGNGTVYLFPYAQTRGSYGLDPIVRSGDKPISGTFDLSNTGIFRHLQVTGNVNKWEAHVCIKANTTYNGLIMRNSVEDMYINTYNQNTQSFKAYKLTRIKYVANTESNGWCVLFYSGEFSTNLLTRTYFFFPVIRFYPAGEDSEMPNITFYVQTKFCFKAD